MRSSRALVALFIPLSLTALLALAQSAPAPATATAASASNKVAVVNLRQLYDRLDEKLDADRALEKAHDDFAHLLEAKKAEIEHLTADVEHPTMFKPGSPEQLKLQDDLLQKTVDIQAFTQLCQQKLFIQLRIKTLAIRRRMDDAIAAYAQAHGIVLVLVSDQVDLAAARTAEELDELPTMRKLAYFQDSFDITRTLVEKMNMDYSLHQK